jgi:tyrosine-specific transport protein
MNLVLAKEKNTLGATLLVTGCCIGAGMIGLPISSLMAGFLPSSVAMALSYLFTTGTGLLLLEATLWFDQKVNLLSIVQFALGKKGKVLTGTLFLLLFYSIFIAYMDGGGQLFASFLSAAFNHPVSREAGIFLSVSLTGAIIYAGTQTVDRINRGLMIGLATSYLVMVIIGMSHIKFDRLLHIDWKASLATLPILFICFGYQNLVPSLTYYLKKNVQALRFAIVVGNLIPLFFYLLWNFVILGMVPTTNSFRPDMVSNLLQNAAQSASVLFAVQAFTFFALFTSFLAVAISFVDFFKDGLKLPSISKKMYEFVIYALVFGPPMLFSLSYPHVFLKALEFAGGIVDVILFGMLPALVVWIGRYAKKMQGPYTVPGGKLFLGLMLLLSATFLLLRLS